MKLPRVLCLLLACSLALYGCARLVNAQVTTFHTLSSNTAGKSVAIFPGLGERDSLERRAYSAKLAQRFAAAGYRVLDWCEQCGKPDYVVLFSYGIDNGTLVSQTFSIPQWGVTGYSGSQTTGTISSFGNMSTFNASTLNVPQYGITGYSTGTYTSKVFSRAIVLDLFDTSKLDPKKPSSIAAAKVYEAKITSEGSCGSMAGIIDPLLDALFKDFPGESGKVRREIIPWDPSNCGH